jgi:hypothetical protein
MDKKTIHDKRIDIKNEIYINREVGDTIVENLSSIKRYSFFKDKIVEDKIKLNDSDLFSAKGGELKKEKTRKGLISDLIENNVISSIKDKVIKKPKKTITNGGGLYYADTPSNKENKNWLNDHFPKKSETYSEYHPEWSFPDDRESLDYYPGSDSEFEKPESFPERATDQAFSFFYRGGIKISSNMSGVPIYIDGKYIGDTPINKPVQVEPGWHQVSGFSPVYKRLSSMNTLQYINFDPIIHNNESYGSETTYIESGKVETVHLKFNQMGDTPKKWKEIKGGMSVGIPFISLIFGLIIWGIA